ncbi:MAG: SCO family protein [Bacteroidota bacterium]
MVRILSRSLLVVFIISIVSRPTLVFANDGGTHVQVGIDEKLGKQIPLSLKFKDETSSEVSLRDVADGKPLIIDMAYFTCPGICDNVLVGLSDVLEKVDATPGRDFRVATISFDPNDTPVQALSKKEQYWGMLKRPFPSDDWKFLTGDSVTIHKLTDAMGFYFVRDRFMKFTHPTAIIIVSGDGKISRYMYGTSFLPIDLKMALMEAKEDRVASVVGKMLQMCFSYDPAGNRYVFNILRVVGVATLVFLAGFIGFLITSKRFVKSKMR